MSNPIISTSEIQKLVGKMQVLKFHSPVIENAKDFICWGFEYDVMSISKSGMVCEFEVKISRADFKKDFKKRKRNHYTQIAPTKHEYYSDPLNYKGTPNYYSYVCPDGLIKLGELPIASGLYYVVNGELVEQRKPKQLHKHIHERKEMVEKVCRLSSERLYLGSARMTFEKKKTMKFGISI